MIAQEDFEGFYNCCSISDLWTGPRDSVAKRLELDRFPNEHASALDDRTLL